MLDRMRLRSVVIGAVIAILTVLTPIAGAAEPTVEDRVIALINAERAEHMTVHWGLLSAARKHSADMSREGRMSHEGADERVNSAPPDPGEFNGAPDDGFGVAAWCENVTYTIVPGAEAAARRIFDQWHRGGAHERCMMDTSRNVGAVGVYYDGQNWWATFIAEKDSTPPGGAPPTAKPKPAAPADRQKTPKPHASARPSDDPADDASSPTSAPQATPVAVVATAAPSAASSAEPDVGSVQPDEETRFVEPASVEAPGVRDVPAIAASAAVAVAPQPGIGWPELAATAAVLALATVVLRRWFVERTPPSRDVPLVADVDGSEVLGRV